MNKSFTFTYIISYRHSPERLNNLKTVLEWINGFTGVEVIVVEQDKHSKIREFNLKCKHIFLKSKMPFNKSWGFNVGMKYSNSNVIIFGDSDLVMAPEKFIESINLLSQYEMVSPYNSVIDLTTQESSLPITRLSTIDRPGRGETDIQKVPLCGGICIFRKSAVEKIGGWDQKFIGWGGEDDFQSIKVKNFLTWTESSGKCYHLYHERTAPDMKWYQRNLQLLQKLEAMSKEELHKVINSSLPKLVIKNLYDNY